MNKEKRLPVFDFFVIAATLIMVIALLFVVLDADNEQLKPQEDTLTSTMTQLSNDKYPSVEPGVGFGADFGPEASWWLLARDASFSIINERTTSQRNTVTVLVTNGICELPRRIEMVSINYLHVFSLPRDSGKPVELDLELQPGQRRRFSFNVVGPQCMSDSDPRDLFAQVAVRVSQSR